jgi:hypothetical protein
MLLRKFLIKLKGEILGVTYEVPKNRNLESVSAKNEFFSPNMTLPTLCTRIGPTGEPHHDFDIFSHTLPRSFLTPRLLDLLPDHAAALHPQPVASITGCSQFPLDFLPDHTAALHPPRLASSIFWASMPSTSPRPTMALLMEPGADP